jgi:hypothetical protein
MRSTLVRLILCLTAVTGTGVVRGDTTVDATYRLTVGGKNSDGTNIDSIIKDPPHPISDPSFIRLEDSVEGSTDSGFATTHVDAFATHLDKEKLLGFTLEGGASAVTPPGNTQGSGPDPGTETGGGLTIGYRDSVTFDVFGPQPLELTHIVGFLKLHGSMNVSTSATGIFSVGEASVGVTIDGTGIASDSHRAVFQTAGQPKGSMGRENLNIIPFEYDVFPGDIKPIELTIFVSGAADAHYSSNFLNVGSGAGAFNASFGSTLEWGGITSVTNARTGEPITDWSVTSESGFDYSQVFPIPEPSALTLLLTAAAAVALRHRRR